MDPCMYLVMASPATTPMTPGKLAAQAAHAAVEAYLISDQNKQVVNRWRCGGHYKKIVLMTDDLTVAERYINDRGFKTAAIIDEGRTEFEGDLTPTAIGVEILNKDELHVRETFSAFLLYSIPDPIAFDEKRYCYCPSPQEIDGSCMRCGMIVNEQRAYAARPIVGFERLTARRGKRRRLKGTADP